MKLKSLPIPDPRVKEKMPARIWVATYLNPDDPAESGASTFILKPNKEELAEPSGWVLVALTEVTL